MASFLIVFAFLKCFVATLIFKSVDCQTFDGIPGCRTTRLELVFLIDTSSSDSYSDFKTVRQWIRNMSLNFDISPYSTRIAVIQYSSYPRTEFGLNTYSDISGVLRGVDDMELMPGSTQTYLTFEYVIESVFSETRRGAAKVVILLSDGRSQDQVYAASLSLHAYSIATFAVTVGDMTSSFRTHEFSEITSRQSEYANKVFNVDDFDSLGMIQDHLIDAVCDQTIQECPSAAHDLTFVIDASSTIEYDDFMKVKQWMKKIVNAFDIGPDHTRVAVIQYSTNVREEFNFNDLLSKEDIINAIDHMEYMMGDTNTGDALLYMLNAIYTERNGDRPNIPDLAIVMTDGKAQETDVVVAASRAVREAGITVYAVGVGDYSLDELQEIASDPDEKFVLEALNFDIVELKRVGLVKSICSELTKTCPTAYADLVFLVDGSTSIGSRNFEKIKQWMKNIVDAFQVGAFYTRIAVVQFTETPHLEFGLNDFGSTQSTLKAIQNIGFRRGSTNIRRAIDFTVNRVFSESRRNTPKILIAVTDEQAHDGLTKAVNRATEAGVHTLVFGVSNSQPNQLRAMLSDTQSVFQTYGFDEIRRMQSKLISLICMEAEPECYSQEIDLHFLVDSSSSISPRNFAKVKTWMKNIVRSFDIGEYTTRVAVTQFSASVTPEFNLNEYFTEREVEFAINRLELNGGPTMAAAALDYVRRHGFTIEAGGRPSVPKVLIIITDRRSGENMEEAVRYLHQSGVHVFSVGTGDTWRSGMEVIGSQTVLSHIQGFSSYDVINRIRRDLILRICRDTKPECPETEMDLLFLIDGSSSIGRSNFEITKEWIISFVKEFEIGEYNARIGVVHYSTGIRSEIDIGAYDNLEDLISAITRIEFSGGATNTAAALEYIRNVAYSNQQGARRGVPKVLIILSDGATQEQVSRAATSLRKDGVEVYAIGVGRANMRELNAVMTQPLNPNVYHVRNYGAIKSIKSGLIRRVCHKVSPDCGRTSTDLMFLVDGSTSVGAKGWTVIKHFMANVTEKFKINRDFVRVGVIQYSTHPQTSIEMGDYTSKEDLLNALWRMKWQSGNTYTARALRYVLQSYNDVPPRPNTDENKLLIIITDGQAQDNLEIIPAIKALHNSGWRVFAIGIDQALLSELNVLASNPDYDHVFYADDFLSTRKFQGRLARLICGDPRYENRLSRPHSFLSPDLPTSLVSNELKSNRLISRRPSTVPDTPASLLGQPQSTQLPVEKMTTALVHEKNLSLECSILWRNGEKVRGVDLLESLNIREDSRTFKSRRGSVSTTEAFRVKQGLIPSTPLELLVTRGLPLAFSLISVFKMHGKTIKDTWTLMSVVSSSGITIFAVSFNGLDRTIYVTRTTNSSLSFVETKSLGGPLVATLFDHLFHKLELIVESDGVTVMIDCQQVPKRMKFGYPAFIQSNLVASFVISQRRATILYIQELTLVCGENSGEQCCELPGKKCALPSAISAECGCLPRMKSTEVREAEAIELRKIATSIANQIVEEKLTSLMEQLKLNANSSEEHPKGRRAQP